MSQPCRLGQTLAGRQIKLRQGLKKKVIRREVFWSPPRRHSNFCLKQLWLNGRDNRDRYFVLERKNVRQGTFEPVRPDVGARHCINQLTCDADLPCRLAHGPFEDIPDAKSTPDFLDVDRLTFECKARVASNHKQPFEA